MEKQESGASTSDGGAKGEQQQETPKSVSYDDHKRALDDLNKFKGEWKKSQEAINATRAELESLKNQRLAEKEDYKTLAEKYQAELKQKDTELTQFRDGFFTSKKYDAVYASALKAGLRGEAEADLSLLPLDGVEVERTDHGRVMVHGSDSYVERLKRERPHWFKSEEPPRVNSGGGKLPSNEPLTRDKVYELEKAYRKSGSAKDKEAWQKAAENYLSSRRA